MRKATVGPRRLRRRRWAARRSGSRLQPILSRENRYGRYTRVSPGPEDRDGTGTGVQRMEDPAPPAPVASPAGTAVSPPEAEDQLAGYVRPHQGHVLATGGRTGRPPLRRRAGHWRPTHRRVR